MLVGYARVSTSDQKLDMQEDALRAIGCEKIFTDIASGARDSRDGLSQAMEYIRKGDTLVVWKLDRLGRSLKHLIEFVNNLNKEEIGFRSLQESIDTTTPGGRLIFHLFGALAEFEREIIRERTQAGLKAARVRGRMGGRPAKMDERKISRAKTLFKDPETTVKEVCVALEVSKATLYRYVDIKKIRRELSM